MTCKLFKSFNKFIRRWTDNEAFDFSHREKIMHKARLIYENFLFYFQCLATKSARAFMKIKIETKQERKKFTFFVPNRSWGAFSLMRVGNYFLFVVFSQKLKFSLLSSHKWCFEIAKITFMRVFSVFTLHNSFTQNMLMMKIFRKFYDVISTLFSL